MNQISTPPIFIIGVPRSGTTLLRIMLDSHPNIVCGPESPWLCGVYGQASLKKLFYDLVYDRYGPVQNLGGVELVDIAKGIRYTAETIFEKYCLSMGKKRWAEKTPQNITQIPFIYEIFPDAIYIHIIRDGRDVACSTVNKTKQGVPVKKILYDQENDIYIKNTRMNALKRWYDWNRVFEAYRKEFNLNCLLLKYEDIISFPRFTMQTVLEFLGEPWDEQVLQYQDQEHNMPSWERGTSDVIDSKGIDKNKSGKWLRGFTAIEKMETKIRYDRYLISLGYEPTPIMH